MYSPDDVAPLGPYALCMAYAERGLIQAALDQYDGDLETAAGSLRVSEPFLRQRVHELGLVAPVTPVLQAVPMPEPVAPPPVAPVAVEEPPRPRPMAISRPRVASPIASPVAAPATSTSAQATPDLSLEEREALARSLLEDEEDDDE